MDEKLNPRLERTNHKGKTIYYADYTGLLGEELAGQIRENGRMMSEQEAQGELNRLSLVDIRDCFATAEVVNAFKEVARNMGQELKAVAVVGVTGLRKHLLAIVNRVSGLGAKPFDTVEQARDWLASQ
ncbi:hypothetical protein ACFL2Q_03410 [Thermodesulfobacteriota bacterium]